MVNATHYILVAEISGEHLISSVDNITGLDEFRKIVENFGKVLFIWFIKPS